jgi:hypothetical protein
LIVRISSFKKIAFFVIIGKMVTKYERKNKFKNRIQNIRKSQIAFPQFDHQGNRLGQIYFPLRKTSKAFENSEMLYRNEIHNAIDNDVESTEELIQSQVDKLTEMFKQTSNLFSTHQKISKRR